MDEIVMDSFLNTVYHKTDTSMDKCNQFLSMAVGLNLQNVVHIKYTRNNKENILPNIFLISHHPKADNDSICEMHVLKGLHISITPVPRLNNITVITNCAD